MSGRSGQGHHRSNFYRFFGLANEADAKLRVRECAKERWTAIGGAGEQVDSHRRGDRRKVDSHWRSWRGEVDGHWRSCQRGMASKVGGKSMGQAVCNRQTTRVPALP
eukprot:353894-Chlamydomonas_euryale.AAC.6